MSKTSKIVTKTLAGSAFPGYVVTSLSITGNDSCAKGKNQVCQSEKPRCKRR